jgi:hypothetical protein
LPTLKQVEAADSRFMTTFDNETVTVQSGLSSLLRLNGRDITLKDLQSATGSLTSLRMGRTGPRPFTVERRGE